MLALRPASPPAAVVVVVAVTPIAVAVVIVTPAPALATISTVAIPPRECPLGLPKDDAGNHFTRMVGDHASDQRVTQ